MLPPDAINEYAEAVTGERPVQPPALISSTNNPVYRIETARGASYVLKCLADPGLDVRFELRVNRHLQPLIRTQEVISADSTRSAFPCDVIVARHYRGTDAATLVESGQMTAGLEDKLTTFMLQTFDAIGSLRMPRAGFGIHKNDRGMHPTWESFIRDYIARYVGRLEALDNPEPWGRWKRCLFEEFNDLLNRNRGPAMRPVSLDTNLKNFLYLPDTEEFLLLNVPLVAVTDQRHGIAEMASQLQGRAYELFLQKVERYHAETLADRRAFQFYQTLALTGVLAYIVAHRPADVRHAHRWGYPVPMYDYVADYFARLKLRGKGE